MRRSSVEMRSKGYQGRKEFELRKDYLARQFVSEFTLEPDEKHMTTYSLTNRNNRYNIKK